MWFDGRWGGRYLSIFFHPCLQCAGYLLRLDGLGSFLTYANDNKMYLLSNPMSDADGRLTMFGIPCFLDKNWPGFGCRQEANVPMSARKV